MKFTLSTKPLVDALNLGVINGNVSKFYAKSCVIQLTASKRDLKMNLEASNVYTEIILKGSGDEDGPKVTFVDCLLFKQLLGTLETSTVTIEYVEGGIAIHSGSSKFNLPSMNFEGAGDLSLKSPELAESNAPSITIQNSDWKFIKDHQMFARAMSFIYPIYTRVWIGKDGTVIVGDFGQQLFTTSKKGSLGETCLLEETIVNLFNSLPENATLTQLGKKNYRIDVKTDGFEYAAEFAPQYEGDEGVGNYKSEVFLQAMQEDETNCFNISLSIISKALSQAELLNTDSDASITMSLKDEIGRAHV